MARWNTVGPAIEPADLLSSGSSRAESSAAGMNARPTKRQRLNSITILSMRTDPSCRAPVPELGGTLLIDHQMPGAANRSRAGAAAQAAIAVISAILLFWGLTDRYLWQDEAATAVLATRLLKFGRPLAYDGVNLVTIDLYDSDQDAMEEQAAGPEQALEYHLSHGEFKPETVWKWQPWGQFVVAAGSFLALGRTTLAARLPFAIAGFATVLLLFRLVSEYFGSRRMATLAALFLLGNSYWILHTRQCRYYSLSSLGLVLTLWAFARWQAGRRGSTLAFVAAAWCWFQVDYGTVWPVLAVLLPAMFFAARKDWRRCAILAAMLAASIAPFFYYYELWGRVSEHDETWKFRFLYNVFNMNEYVAPAFIVAAAGALLMWRWRSLPPSERGLIAVSGAILVALALWIPSVSILPFLRYAIIAAPVGALLTAWVLVRICGSRAAYFAWPIAALLIATPWASMPLRIVAQWAEWPAQNPWFRSELIALRDGVFTRQPDPNRIVIEWLQANAAPSDEILINYEDLPLTFYLPNPIRGGISAFRVEDDSRTPPRFVVLRHSVPFVNWPIFLNEVNRYRWAPVPLKAPDVVWGNNPDPAGQDEDPARAPILYIARRIDP